MKQGPLLFHVVLRGAPATKKNHQQLSFKGKRPRAFPSKQYQKWVKEVEVETYVCINHRLPIAQYVNVCAHIYREKKTGDAVGYYQAIGDFLELCVHCTKRKCQCWLEDHILADDKWIASWDGSRRLKDKDNPRIELWITGVDYE